MSKFYLKDWHGKEKEFTDDKIFVRGENGKLIQFTQGEGASPDLRYVTFMSYDGLTEYGKKAVAVGDDCADPIARGVFATPTRESDEQYNYYFYGWATTPNGGADANWNKAITEDKVVYANYFTKVNVARGECGENCTWKLEGDGLLTISGVGAMANYANKFEQPWVSHASDIKTIIIEHGITEIGEYAFGYLQSVTSVTIKSGVTRIGNNAFYQCNNITSITIPNTVETIGWYAFGGCKLTELAIPDSVTRIENYAFMSNKFTTLTLPDTVAYWGNCVFQACDKLNRVTLPSNMTTIPIQFFVYCSALTNITIPASVNFIGHMAFYGCDALTTATFKDTSGWYVTQTKDATSGTSVSLTNASTAATYLRSTYSNGYYWYNPTATA